MSPPSFELRLAAHVLSKRPDFCGAAERHTVRRALLDTIGCAVAGRQEPAAVIARTYARQASPSGGAASLWSGGEKLPVEMAAWVNGIEAHVLDFDDVSSPMRGHPSVAMLPALVAIAEARDLSLGAVEEAYEAAYDALCRMSRAVAVAHYAHGWHTTATLGTLAGVMCCARLIGLDETRFCHALGIALAQLAGSRGNFGTMSKSLQAGQAGMIAVRSALLAEAGFDGAVDALSGPQGFLHLYTQGGDFTRIFDEDATPASELTRSGLEVKKYPLCYATHRALDAVLDLRAEYDMRLDAVARIGVKCSHGAFVPLIHHRPQTGLEAKFSIEYAMIAALQDGEVTLSSFEDAAVQRSIVQERLGDVVVIESAGAVMPRWAEVTLVLRDGRALARRADQLRGSAELPLSDDELRRKAVDCFAHGGSERGPAIASTLLASADQPVRDIMAMLAMGPSSV